MADSPDLDELIFLYPMEGQDVLRRLMGEDSEIDTEHDTQQDEDY